MTPREWLLFALAIMWCLFGIFVAIFKPPHWSADIKKIAPKGTFPKRAGRCKPPDFETFDIDVHDCPCGHLYGDHEYEWATRTRAGVAEMRIDHCLPCDQASR